jgi:two-component system, sensor histidine kinase and response regulator
MYYKKAASNKNITIHLQATQTYYPAFVDENITRQVLDNLISNAIKYSPLGKNVYIRLINDEQSIKCEIQDEGQGLSKEDLSKLFNKFARLKPQPTAGEHSTGLGLFIVKKLVEKMYGKVWCESELGVGSIFVIEFVKGEQ